MLYVFHSVLIVELFLYIFYPQILVFLRFQVEKSVQNPSNKPNELVLKHNNLQLVFLALLLYQQSFESDRIYLSSQFWNFSVFGLLRVFTNNALKMCWRGLCQASDCTPKYTFLLCCLKIPVSIVFWHSSTGKLGIDIIDIQILSVMHGQDGSWSH